MSRYLNKITNRLTHAFNPDPKSPSNLQPDWPSLIRKDWSRWQSALKSARHGQRVLIATSAGGFAPGAILDTTLAVALTLRGAHVKVLLCDAFLPACTQTVTTHPEVLAEFLQFGPQKSWCPICYLPGLRVFQSLKLPILRYSDYVTDKERRQARQLASEIQEDEIPVYAFNGVAIGEHALAGALRYFARGDLAAEPEGIVVLRRYLEASLLTYYAISHLTENIQVDRICVTHGIYAPHGIIAEVARQRQIPLATWNIAYKKRSFIFSHKDTYHHTLMREPAANWESMPWTEVMEAEIMGYLKSRWQGTRDWIGFHEKPEEEIATIAGQLGVDYSKPCIGLLTNVVWDAQLHYRANAFPNMLDWLLRTIHYFAGRPELQLLIRIHPAEIRGTLASRQPVLAEIQQTFPTLPANIFVIPPESTVSTYAAMSPCNAAIIYGTKMGVELTSMGLPVIVAGEAWIRNKGLTYDASSPDEYFDLLNRLPFAERLSEATVRQARKYAYHFFFRRMIPLEMMEPTPGWPPYRVALNGLDDLMPGRSVGLDVICDGILNGSEFIYPAELQLPAPA